MPRSVPRAILTIAEEAVAVLVSYLLIIAAWVEPAAHCISRIGVWSKGILPCGEAWPSGSPPSSWNMFVPLHDLGWSGFFHWFDSTPEPALLLLCVAAASLALRLAAHQWLVRREWHGDDQTLRRSPVAAVLDGSAFISWVFIAAAAWRLWWGMMWDRPPGAAVVWFPVQLGSLQVALLWLGASMGYVWTLSIIAGCSRRDGADRCAKCGYSLRGSKPGMNCPECNHDHRLPARATGFKGIAAVALRRHWPMPVALAMLASPYLLTLIAAVAR